MHALQVAIAGGRASFRRLISHVPDAEWIEQSHTCILGDSQVNDPAILNHAARLGDTVVGVGTFILAGGVVGVWNVTPRPAHRRRGIGVTTSVLWSSDAGCRLHERLGYRTVTSVRAYVPPS